MSERFLDVKTRARSISNLHLPPSAHLSKTSSSSDAYHLKRIHAKLIRNGEIGSILAVGKLVADIVASGPSSLSYARSVFDRIEPPRNVFTWNSMIRGYAHGPTPEEGISSYRKMLHQGLVPNNYTFPFVFRACTQLMDLPLGLQIHGSLIKYGLEDSDAFIRTSLVSFYAACGAVETARHLFDESPDRDVTCWNALIKGYVKSCRYLDAIAVFRAMQDEMNVQADEITMLAVVSACAHLGALDMGRWIHAYIDKNQRTFSVCLGTALIEMYAKCGDIDEAKSMFKEMTEKDVRAWSSMIIGLALHGHAKEALDLFSEMQAIGVQPDSVTFTGALSACSHSGLVQEGFKILDSMTNAHSIEPTIEHYGCMVDLLGRAGLLHEALCLIRRIPLERDVALWGALLVACRTHKNIEMGELVAKEILKLDPSNGGVHIFLSNIYAAKGNWNQVQCIRSLMKEQRIKKLPGSSLIELWGRVHEFISGDQSHPWIHKIYKMLDEIMRLLTLEGYSRSTQYISFDMDEEDKEQIVSQHSEKLAVAFGLLSTNEGSTLRVVNNLRVCEDCHSAMKLVSKIFNRIIIIRDRNRFHHFKDGYCSCRDYW